MELCCGKFSQLVIKNRLIVVTLVPLEKYIDEFM